MKVRIYHLTVIDKVLRISCLCFYKLISKYLKTGNLFDAIWGRILRILAAA